MEKWGEKKTTSQEDIFNIIQKRPQQYSPESWVDEAMEGRTRKWEAGRRIAFLTVCQNYYCFFEYSSHTTGPRKT